MLNKTKGVNFLWHKYHFNFFSLFGSIDHEILEQYNLHDILDFSQYDTWPSFKPEEHKSQIEKVNKDFNLLFKESQQLYSGGNL